MRKIPAVIPASDKPSQGTIPLPLTGERLRTAASAEVAIDILTRGENL